MASKSDPGPQPRAAQLSPRTHQGPGRGTGPPQHASVHTHTHTHTHTHSLIRPSDLLAVNPHPQSGAAGPNFSGYQNNDWGFNTTALPPSFSVPIPRWPTRQSVQFSSVAQSCPTLCDPMNCSMPGLPVHHQLPEFTHTHVHQVGDTIQPPHPLSSPSPPAPNPTQHQSLFQGVNFSHQVAKVLEFQL